MNTATKTMISLILISLLSIWFTFNYAIELSSFAVGLAKYIMSILLWWIVDYFFIKDIDTLKIVGGNPIAYSIFVLANAILLAACIATS